MRQLTVASRVMKTYFGSVRASLSSAIGRTNADHTSAGGWIAADQVSILWYIQTYRDLPRLRKALARVRASYPESQILVVSDGDPDPAIRETSDQYAAEYSLQPRLYGVEHGGELVQRILNAFLDTGAEVLLKIDPDTNVRRRFTVMPAPTERAVYGTVQSIGSTHVSIQGGCMIVPRQAATLLVSSALLLSDRLKPPALEWAVDATAKARARSGLSSSDQTLGWACRELCLSCRNHPEVFSRYRPSLMDTVTQRRVAVYHPRFEIAHIANPDFYFSGLRHALRNALTARDDISPG